MITFEQVVTDEVLEVLKYANIDQCEEIARRIMKRIGLKEAPYPKEDGYYWFYGDPFAKGNGHKTETRVYSVKVFHVNISPRYIADGDYFMNNNPGLWAKAFVPEAQDSQS